MITININGLTHQFKVKNFHQIRKMSSSWCCFQKGHLKHQRHKKPVSKKAEKYVSGNINQKSLVNKQLHQYVSKYPLLEKHSERQSHNRTTKRAGHWEFNESKLTGTKQNQTALRRWDQCPVTTGAFDHTLCN